jgi:2,4-dienoyl-CoA reductase-like NADH-dependent reductase (Old Yellow Enzyme family)
MKIRATPPSRKVAPISSPSGCRFLANPDLPDRYARHAGLNAPHQATFYAGEEKGYVDYPALAGA